MTGLPSRCLRPESRLLANGILGQTHVLVRHALRGDWNGVLAAAMRRRDLMGRLRQECLPVEAGPVAALGQAVEEAEKALALVEELNELHASSALQ